MPRVLKRCCNMTVCNRIGCKDKDVCKHSKRCKNKKYVDDGEEYVCVAHDTDAKVEAPDCECSICWSDIEPRDVKKTSCKHVFHKECLKKWLERNPSCPNCRSIILRPGVYYGYYSYNTRSLNYQI